MSETIGHMQKYVNYREQMTRLKRAMNARFYLEAISIEYAIIEDRIESALRHAGVFRPDKHNMLNKKLNKLSAFRGENGLAKKYFPEELIQEIHSWKNERNPMTHALLNLHLHTEDLKEVAERGESIMKKVNSKVSLYNRALDRLAEKKS